MCSSAQVLSSQLKKYRPYNQRRDGVGPRRATSCTASSAVAVSLWRFAGGKCSEKTVKTLVDGRLHHQTIICAVRPLLHCRRKDSPVILLSGHNRARRHLLAHQPSAYATVLRVAGKKNASGNEKRMTPQEKFVVCSRRDPAASSGACCKLPTQQNARCASPKSLLPERHAEFPQLRSARTHPRTGR